MSDAPVIHAPPRILVLAYRFPPQGGGGVQRPAKMVASWSRDGAAVEVLSGPLGFVDLEDPSLLSDLPPGLEPRRVPDPSPWVLLLRARRALSRRRATLALGRGAGLAGELVRRACVPDGLMGWITTTMWAGSRIAREFRPDVVFVTGPPFTPFVAGALLARRLRIPLVLDYRDPWTASYLPRRDTPWLARRLNPLLETWVLGRSAGVIAAHRAVFRHLRPLLPGPAERRPRILWVPNGYDARDFGGPAAVGPDTFTLSYTGSFYKFRSPKPLLDALEELLRDGSIRRETFRFRVAGESERLRALCAPGSLLLDVLEPVGYVPHARSVRLLRESTVNLVLEGDTGGPNLHTPGKTYEALYAGRPVLLLCPEGTTTRLARRTGGAWIAHPEDRAAIRAAVLDLYTRWRGHQELETPDREQMRFYDRERQARRALELLRAVAFPNAPAQAGE